MDMTRKQKKREKDSWFFSKSLLQEINELSEEVDDELEKVKNGPQKRIEEEPTSIAAVSNSKEEKSRQGSVAPKILPMKIKEEISDSQKLKDENHQLRKQLELLEKIQQDMLNNQSEVTAITKKLTVQNEQLERENKKLSDKISEEEKDELMNQELIYERQQLKDKVLLLSRKIEELKPKMQQLLSEKEALISQNNTLTKKIEGLIPSTESTSNEADEKEFSQLKEALYAAHGNIIHLQEQATEEHHKFEILEKENMELTSTVESLHKKILEKKDIEHEQSKRLAIQNNQLIATAEQVNELNKKIAELQGTYDAEKQKTQRLEKKIEQQEKDKLFHQEEVSKILLSARKQGDGIIQDAQKQAEKIMLVAEEKIQKKKDESKELYRSLVASQQEYQIIYEKMEKQLLHFVKED